MKKHLIKLLIIVIVCMNMMACNVGESIVGEMDPKSDMLLTEILDALSDDDADAAYEVMLKELIDKQTFVNDFHEQAKIWGDKSEYTFTKGGAELSVEKGLKKYVSTYAISKSDGTYYIAIVSRAEYETGQNGVYNFMIQRAEAASQTKLQ